MTTAPEEKCGSVRFRVLKTPVHQILTPDTQMQISLNDYMERQNVKPILLDGSNVSLAGSGSGKLTSLSALLQMIYCLLENGFTPYTIFDASFKHRIAEDSQGRIDFNHLTKQVSKYFQMSPAGEEADLFLLQLALELKCPVISNDTFKKYGKISANKLRYEGCDVPVYRFQMFAGVVVVPDLKIRRKIDVTDKDLTKIEALFAAPSPTKKPVSNPPEKNDPSEKAQKIIASSADITDNELRGIKRVISRFVSGGSNGGQTGLSQRLSVHRNNYIKRTGISDKSGHTWFGYSKLSDFLRAHFPEAQVEQEKSEAST